MRRWWWRILMESRPQTAALVQLSALMIAIAGMDALKPWPMKLLVDEVLAPKEGAPQVQWIHLLPGGNSASLLILWLGAFTVLLYCAAQALRLLQNMIQTVLGSQMAYALGARVFEQLQNLSPLFHQQRQAGDLVRRVVTDSACARDLMLGVILPGGSALVSLVIMFVIMVRLDSMLAWVAISFAVPLGLVIRYFSSPMSTRSYEQQELEGQLLSHAEQTLGALTVVQSFTRESDHDRRFHELGVQTLRAYLRAILSQLWFKIGTSFVTAIGTVTIMVIGGRRVLDGQLTLGSLLVFLTYLASLYSPLETLAYLSVSYASASAGARRVLEVLDSNTQIIESPQARTLATHAPLSVVLADVSFGYEPGRMVLEEINLELKAGEVTALVGPTGAGKSTLASLIPRLFDPWSGRVLVGGEDVKDLKLVSVRGQVSVVPQEAFLLPLSIRENIAYGNPSAGMEQIRSAAQAAGAEEFIEALPLGYETVLGERGSTLSAGQRQRLSIARALLKDAPILLLDEPTSALDAQTEAGVVEAVHRLMAGRTCLVIAHRLSTVRRADQIVVLEQGRIVQRGRHETLIREPGLYRTMCELQFGTQLVRA